MTNRNAAIGIGAALVALLLYRRKPIATVTTSEGFDLGPYGGPTIYPASIIQLGQAIARAEGFYIAGSIPQRAHNPGDLKVPNWSGPTLGEGISVFASDSAGWAALNKQLYAILTGRSSVYSLDDTIASMSRKWTGGDNADTWARNVAGFVTHSTDDPLWAVLA
jgi:hypothetical protein